jgi:ferrochelatase
MIAVLLLGFGGPECLADVGPFIERVTGREQPPDRLAASVERYRVIGGGSPLCRISRGQGDLLEAALKKAGADAKVYLGMRHWFPDIDEATVAAAADKPERYLAVCLTPYFSRMSSGDYIEAAEQALESVKPGAKLEAVTNWNTEPELIEAFSEGLKDTLALAGEDAAVLFTAHSLPREMIDAGDPYADQVEETVRLTAAATGLESWLFGWQSAGHGRGEWLKPAVEERLVEAEAGGAKAVVVAPVGFISDHVETLYDLDIVLKNQANDLGLEYYRTPGLNDSGLLAEAMASAIMRRLDIGGNQA